MNLLTAALCSALLIIHQLHATFIDRRFKQTYRDSGLSLESPDNGDDVGGPLILTPYLKKRKIQEAQEAALVQIENLLGVKSYSGYFTVNAHFNSNLYFWFFPSVSANAESDPVVLWLNGGPGASSLSGVFDEHGPFIVDENSTISLRDYSWNKNHSLLYIDNPVGVGFSFTDDDGLASNETKVGEDLYCAMTQFFQLFPDLKANDFFIGGESYGSKFATAIGYTILKKNPQANVKINLQGILIGNGWIDPIHQFNYAPFVYNTGLVTAVVAEEIAKKSKEALQNINEGDYASGIQPWSELLDLVTKHADVDIYNYVKKYDDSSDWPTFITTDEMRKTIHVGNNKYFDKGAKDALANDELQSVAPWVESLLENYRVLIYTGQFDIICGYPMVLEYLNHLSFTGAEEFKNANRTVWLMGSEPAGYARIGGNLTELMVRNSGHMVPRDQPEWASEMLFRFTRNYPFN